MQKIGASLTLRERNREWSGDQKTVEYLGFHFEFQLVDSNQRVFFVSDLEVSSRPRGPRPRLMRYLFVILIVLYTCTVL